MTVGLFTIDTAARRASGYLLPYDVPSKGISASGTRPITFPRGNIALPEDPMVIGLNEEHGRFNVIGRADVLEDREPGVWAEFAIAKTKRADAWLAEHGDSAFFSAEIDDLTRAPGDIGAGVLAGAAVTVAPAFDGTGLALFSLLGEEHEAPTPEPTEPTPVVEEEEPDEDQAEQEGEDMPEATVPNTMLASRRQNTDSAPQLTRAGFFSALNVARRTGDKSALLPYAKAAAEIGMFALSNVHYDGVGGLVTDAGIPGSWLGELWQGRRFQRKIVPLLTQGTLTSLSATGWVWGIKPAMAAWTGNKTPIPSNAPTVLPKEFGAQRFAGGHDLAVEFYHFNQTDVINSYADAMIDSYAELSDGYALVQLTGGATVFTPDPGNTVNTGLLDIVDGALAVTAGGGTPSWAIVAPDIFKGILATPREDALDYLSASIGLESGAVNGGGSFQIIPDSRLAAGGIVVGDKGGATAWELPGVPIRVEANDLILGGVDNAFFGYISVGVTNPNVIVKNAEAGLTAGVEEGILEAANKTKK